MAIKTTDSCAVITDRLTRRFGSFIAVNDVSFQASCNEVLGFLRPNRYPWNDRAYQFSNKCPTRPGLGLGVRRLPCVHQEWNGSLADE